MGGEYNADELTEAALSQWLTNEPPFIVCTGGEPMLQLDNSLISALRARGSVIAVETNGTIPVTTLVDWIAVSPKIGTELLQQSGNEIKLVFPQRGLDPSQYESYDFDHFYLQPIDDKKTYPNSVAQAIDYCLEYPKWKLSLQTQKFTGIK